MSTLKAQITPFDLKTLGRRLKDEPAWREKKRNSAVLFKEGDRHAYLVAMHAATFVPDHRTPCPINLYLLEGQARIVTDRQTVVLREGGLAALDAGTHYKLESEKESLFVLEFFPSGSKHAVSKEEDDYFDNWV